MEFLGPLGFASGVVPPCAFRQRSRRTRLTARGDYFALLASDEDLDCFDKKIKDEFAAKVSGQFGPRSEVFAGNQEKKAVHEYDTKAKIIEWEQLLVASRMSEDSASHTRVDSDVSHMVSFHLPHPCGGGADALFLEYDACVWCALCVFSLVGEAVIIRV